MWLIGIILLLSFIYDPKRFITGLLGIIKDKKNELKEGQENISEFLQRVEENKYTTNNYTPIKAKTLNIQKIKKNKTILISSRYISLMNMPINTYVKRTTKKEYLVFRKSSNVFIFYNKDKYGIYLEGPHVKENSVVWEHTDFYITKKNVTTMTKGLSGMEKQEEYEDRRGMTKQEEYEDRRWMREMSDIIGHDQSW